MQKSLLSEEVLFRGALRQEFGNKQRQYPAARF